MGPMGLQPRQTRRASLPKRSPSKLMLSAPPPREPARAPSPPSAAMPPSNEAAWQQRLAALRAHVAAHGRLPPRGDALGLGGWVGDQRRTKKAMDAGRKSKHGTMTPARAAALETIPGWAWDVGVEARWLEKLAALRAFVATHGRLPPKFHPSGLGKWVGKQREAKNAAWTAAHYKMTPERAAALEAVPGWRWDVRRAAAPPAALPAKRTKK